MYQPRTYRRWIKADDLVPFTVVVKETDLYILAESDLEAEALDSVIVHRVGLEKYIKSHPLFLHSLKPFAVADDAPVIVKEMTRAAAIAGVGPMAAVAGAMAEAVGRDLLSYTTQVIVENGGDIYMKVMRPRVVGIYAGESPLTGQIGLGIQPQQTPLGICTSSGMVGPSLSLGTADAVIVVSPSAALADAAATAIGNKVKTLEDFDAAIELAKAIAGLAGVVIIKGDKVGIWGKVQLVPCDTGSGRRSRC